MSFAKSSFSGRVNCVEVDLEPEFTHSSYCALGNCVEVSVSKSHEVQVRDSKFPDDDPLRFTHDEWAAFIKGVKAGEFDLDKT